MSFAEIPGLLARLMDDDDTTDQEILRELDKYGGYDARTSDLVEPPNSYMSYFVVNGRIWLVPRDRQTDPDAYDYPAMTALDRLLGNPPEGMNAVADLWEYSRGSDGDLFPSFMTMVDIEDEVGFFPAETLKVKGLGTEDAKYLGAALTAWSRYGTDYCVSYVQAVIRSTAVLDEDERAVVPE